VNSLDYDFVIIGSGFGGSVCALRLSQKGYKVLVVEKGKWYRAADFARTNWQFSRWLWVPVFRWFGIMKISIFRHVGIVSGTGVGGGSLVYANVLEIPKRSFFTVGNWAKLADWQTELKPFYKIAQKMLGATVNPKLFESDKVLRQVSDDLNKSQFFKPTEVGVYFGEPGQRTKDPYFKGKGPDRSGCIFCGGCMTGCRHNAKNTLDKNYLYLARECGATILPEQEVYDVRPIAGENGSAGYELLHKSTTRIFRRSGKVTARGVIFSGGVLGTVKLLLKLKKTSLPDLSERIGDVIRTNNESLISITIYRKE
jgi:cholesterol oxidase